MTRQIDEWMDGRMDPWITGSMDRSTDKAVDESLAKWMNEQMDKGMISGFMHEFFVTAATKPQTTQHWNTC